MVCVVDENNIYVGYFDSDYVLNEGERIVDVEPPVLRPYAGYPGFIRPRLDGDTWVEDASFAEIIVWEYEHQK